MKFLVPFLGAAALAASASAGFTGFSSVATVGGDGKVVTQVYANFSGSSDTLLNVFGIAYMGGINTSNFGAGNFYHTDFVGGSWAPQFASDPLNDSFLTIGGTAGFANSSNADPAWGGLGFNQPGLVTGAGWFNSNPPNLQGQNIAGKVFIGQFKTDNAKTWEIFAKVGYNAGLSTPTVFGEGVFTVGVPAPGAVALLGLAGLVGRRRRA